MRTVSVIIPTYNHAEYVLESIECVFAQTFEDYEIIVVNDGSPDNTSEVLRPLIAEGRIRYIEQQNRGAASARNRGLTAACGEFIAFLDDDDLWPPGKLAWQVQRLRQDSELVAVGGEVELLDGSRSKSSSSAADWAETEVRLRDMFDGSPFYSPGQVLIRAKHLHEIGGFDEAIWGADDLDLWMRLAAHGRVIKVAYPALIYRVHATNASKSTTRMLRNCRDVIEKNVHLVRRQEHRAARRQGYRWLYLYVGKGTLEQMKDFARAGSATRAVSLLFELSVFALPCLRDRELLKWFLADLCPRQIRPLGGRLSRWLPSSAR